MALKLAEATVTLIRDYVKANMPAALAAVRTDRSDSRVTTEPPKEYFIYYPSHAYQRPAVFVICTEFDFRLIQGPNYHGALARVFVEVLVQDKDKESLVYKTWRYQDALVSLLDNTQLTTPDNGVRIVCKVERATFSGEYSTDDLTPGIGSAVFSKSVMLELNVEHYENKS